jgi:glucose/arabinose dehydrogenase
VPAVGILRCYRARMAFVWARVGLSAPLAAIATTALFALCTAQAVAAPPEVTEVIEPAVDAAPLDAEDVHMVASYADGDGDEHICSDWQIWTRDGTEPPFTPGEAAWEAQCVEGQEKVHIHLGDGEFVGAHAGRTSLLPATAYELRVRFQDSTGEWSEWDSRLFSTRGSGPAGSDSSAWDTREGYVVETFAEDLQLPVNIAMVPNPGPHGGDPFMYVTELYGNVKVITRDGTVRDYATGLLNFNPTGNFPGSGEIGVTGVMVEPATGDLFVSLVYQDEGSSEEPKPYYPKVVRLLSDERGLEAIGESTILELKGAVQGASHQISNLSISPMGNLFVHNGDGTSEWAEAPNLDSYQGKILRMTLGGDPLPTNPYYTDDGEDTARDYVYAKGFRNPFGGAWRLSDGTHWEVENGPTIDRLAKVVMGDDYGWPADLEMTYRASYNWEPAHGPVNVEFVEPQRFGGSGFPAVSMGHAFVTESGPTYATGPNPWGKRIVEFDLAPDGELLAGPITLVEYTGIGKATAAGLAAGPDGLYFTDLYKDTDYEGPTDRGANVLRIRCAGECPLPLSATTAPATPAESAVDVSPPDIRGFRVQRKVFALRAAQRARSSAAKRGTAFLYSLSEPATVRIRLRRVVRGMRLQGKCRPFSALQGARKMGPRRCLLRRRLADLLAPGSAGPNLRAFSGHLNRRRLRPGRYEATIRAVDGSGNRSKHHTTGFRIVSGAH